MFSWSIAKSAEAMFSRWAIKRVCKFLLKKKLGKFILGDIDLNQLDVQLSAGTIQLSDLALNVDYINQKLGTAGIIVKEGSVGSLVVTMPWKDGGCQIEVDELEVVLAPHRVKFSQAEPETCSSSRNENNNSNHCFRKKDNETMNSVVANGSVDIHEGVKTIAKMVKWLLTSLHVKIKKLIVAFDPHTEEENINGLDRILVLRISEVECGTRISEESSPGSFAVAHNFLGLSRLTSFVKFEGVVLELLHVDGLDDQSPPECFTETTLGNWFSGYCSSGKMTALLVGEKGGFSGNLKLSIPWKNGSLDIKKVDADLHIEPIELRLQPSTVRCLIYMSDLFKGLREECEDQGNRAPSTGSFATSSCMFPPDEELLGNGGLVTTSCLLEKEPVNALLSESHLISDWVTKSHEDRNEEEPDFGASVDQFFECFDGLRNSQSALGNSGMWNWTCSVFTAITAASNLASGSLHVPSEQQHVETKLNANIAKVSLLFSFADEYQKQSPTMKDDNSNTDFPIHHVCAQFVNLCLVLLVRPQETNFEVSVHHIQVVDHLSFKNDWVGLKEHDYSVNSESNIAVTQQMQDGVQDALRNFLESSNDPRFKHQVDISLSIQDMNRCCHMTHGKDIWGKDATVTLFKTSGVSGCHVMVNSGSCGGSSMGRTSFSLNLPRFVFWVNFDLITMTLKFLDEIANCAETNRRGSGFIPKTDTKRDRFSPLGNQGGISHIQSPVVSPKRIVENTIFLPNARIILCFPLRERNGFSKYSTCDQFIALDIVSPTIGGKDVRSAQPTPIASSDKRHGAPTSCSLHLNLGDFYLFSISSAIMEKGVGNGAYCKQNSNFCVKNIISFENGTGHLSLISLFWREGCVTGPWIAKKAKLLASSESGGTSDKVVRKGCGFASISTVKDNADFDTHTRHEILSTSSLLLHAQLPPLTINLSRSQYENISSLLNQMFQHFSSIVSDSVKTREEYPASQTSILVECESLTVSVATEPVGDVKCYVLKELPGSWVSLTLQVDKFEFLSVSNIGGIRNSSFFWLAHGQGSLWGSITKGIPREFLLISCSNSTMGRGDGEGSNVLSSRLAGSDIMNLWDPESNHNFTSITVRCATIVAIGGRLDWFSMIITFFCLPSSECEQEGEKNLEKTCGSSFILNLVDIGLSYEPYLKHLVANEGLNPKLADLNADEAKDELYVACLLAASSLKLSISTAVDCTVGKYTIRLHDLGLLLSTASNCKLAGNTYSVEHLRKCGYVKVAQEAHFEALLRTNCQNGHMWELECHESHIMLTTCQDTTFGLIRLASQLQRLFAPDMQDYVVHLENRWNNSQQVHENSEERTLVDEVSPSLSQTQNSSSDNRSMAGNLMDEICEDAFQLVGNFDGQAKIFEPRDRASVGDNCIEPSGPSSSEERIPEFIEEYFLSDLRPLSGLALKSGPADAITCKAGAVGEAQVGNGGWYGVNSLRILENHASKEDLQNNIWQFDVDEASRSDSEHVNVGKVNGCIFIKNMNVTWRMFGGSDWSNFQNTSQPSAMNCGRDATVCLELAFSGIGFDYDVYPDGEINASRLSLTIQDIFLRDKSDHAPWNLVLGYYQSKKHPRKFSSKAVKLNMEAVKPDPSIPLEENRLRIALLPLRLHLHQSQLDFLISFFGGKSSSTGPPSGSLGLSNSGEPSQCESLQSCGISEEAFLTYFQKFDIWPMLIRVDYSPCRVDLTALRGGKYVELVNLVPWKGVELQLRHVQGVGLYGWNSVFETILGEWLEDISKNQIHKLLKGLPPIKSLVAVGSGAAKLVSLPVKNYKKDRRLIKGMQRGTIAFLRSISLEAIGLGVHLAAGAHNILLQAEYILTTIPPSVPWPVESRVATSVSSNQPKDAQQGIQQACQSISDGLGKSASALVQTPLKRYQRGAGVGSALATALQAAPAAAVAPASATARAVHCALLGFRNSLDPEHRRESLEKYLGRVPHQETMP